MKYFFFIDTVAPSEANDSILPGFDYVHGLQGLMMRTYEETLLLFDRSSYSLCKEIPIPNMPNTYLWILSPEYKT